MRFSRSSTSRDPIVTVTLNPAIDLACSAEAVPPTQKTRTFDEHIDPGGGGINVARVLHAMGAETLALVVAGGVTGALIEDLLSEAAVPHETIHCRGRTRIGFTVFDRAAKQEFRFVPQGPVAEPRDWTEVLARLAQIDCDWIVALTLGGDGAILASAAGVRHLSAIPVPFRSAVGAGDSFVAGVLWALSRGLREDDMLRWGVAAGTAAVARAGTARVRRDDVDAWYGRTQLLSTGAN